MKKSLVIRTSSLSANQQIAFVCLAIFSQLIFYRHVASVKKYAYLNTQDYSSIVDIGNISLFAYLFLAISALARIFGAYATGKYIKDIKNLPKMIVLIAKLHLLKSVLLCIFCFVGNNPQDIINSLYIVNFFHTVLIPGTVILPGIYLYKTNPECNWIKISACLATASTVSRLAAVQLERTPEMFIGYTLMLIIVLCGLSWFIYVRITKNGDLEPEKISVACTYKEKIIGITLGATAGTIFFFHSFFLEKYFQDIVIIGNHDFSLHNFQYLVLMILFFFPCVMLCEKYGVYKAYLIAIGGILILSFELISPSHNLDLFIHIAYLKQILFIFFAALFLAPMQATLHKTFKDIHHVTSQIVWVYVGYSVCNVVTYCGSTYGFSHNLPETGRFVFRAILFLCLFSVYKFKLGKEDTDKCYRPIKN